MIEIERGIPMPQKVRGRDAKYPWEKMEVGDSFFVQGRKTFGNQASTRSLKDGKKYTTRKENGGVRVWRLE